MQFTQSIVSKFQYIKIYLRILCKNSLTSLNWFCCRRMKNMRIHRGSIKCSWHIKIGSFSNINRIENWKSNLFVKKIKPAFRCNTIRKNNQQFWSGFECVYWFILHFIDKKVSIFFTAFIADLIERIVQFPIAIPPIISDLWRRCVISSYELNFNIRQLNERKKDLNDTNEYQIGIISSALAMIFIWICM